MQEHSLLMRLAHSFTKRVKPIESEFVVTGSVGASGFGRICH